MSMPLVRWQFRRLLKSASELFRHDSFAMKNARQELRDQFMKNRNMTDHNELAALYRGIDEVDEMMRFNVVQAKMNTRGNYGTIWMY